MNDQIKTFVWILVALANMISFCLYALDKYKAVRHQYRISEKKLLITSLPGPFGALAGMIVCRHKTKHMKFVLIVPILCMMEAYLICRYLYK